MRAVPAISAVLVMAIGCAPVPPAAPAGEAVPVHGVGTCNAGAAQSLVGSQASSEVGAEALRLSGARSLRWIRPGDVVTMDYREDRLNVDLDANGRVAGLRCG